MSVKIKLKVIPNSSRNQIVGWLGSQLKIKVQSQPEKGRANEAVVLLLSKSFDLKKQQIHICSGQTSSNKEMEIDGLTKAELKELLKEYKE